MKIQPINTEKAPKAVGPYSQGIKANGLIFVSGQIPSDVETGDLVKDDIKRATKVCLENVRSVLKEAGASLSDVVKVTIFITDMKDFPLVNEVYGQYFSQHKPARACVEVAGLPMGVNVEIEAIAAL